MHSSKAAAPFDVGGASTADFVSNELDHRTISRADEAVDNEWTTNSASFGNSSEIHEAGRLGKGAAPAEWSTHDPLRPATQGDRVLRTVYGAGSGVPGNSPHAVMGDPVSQEQHDGQSPGEGHAAHRLLQWIGGEVNSLADGAAEISRSLPELASKGPAGYLSFQAKNNELMVGVTCFSQMVSSVVKGINQVLTTN